MAKERRSLSGRVVAITGGGRGIGKTTAAALVRKGCKVAIGDIEADVAKATAAELGGGTIALPLDVTDRASFESFLDETEKQLGPLDVLINNAGIMPVTPFIEESDDSIRRQIDIDYYGVVAGTQMALQRMLPRNSGHVVNIASAAGRIAIPSIATYSGVKHGVVGFSEAVRAELRGSRIEVSCVMPFPVNTALMEGASDQLGIKKVEPEDVANEIVDALEAPRFDVFVPRWLQGAYPASHLLPRRAREAVYRFMGADKLLTQVDASKRQAYEERAAQSRSVDTKDEPPQAADAKSNGEAKAEKPKAAAQKDVA